MSRVSGRNRPLNNSFTFERTEVIAKKETEQNGEIQTSRYFGGYCSLSAVPRAQRSHTVLPQRRNSPRRCPAELEEKETKRNETHNVAVVSRKNQAQLCGSRALPATGKNTHKRTRRGRGRIRGEPKKNQTNKQTK